MTLSLKVSWFQSKNIYLVSLSVGLMRLTVDGACSEKWLQWTKSNIRNLHFSGQKMHQNQNL